ncbi:MAG: alpha/beta fold hydrolase [Myxococcota bacterium]
MLESRASPQSGYALVGRERGSRLLQRRGPGVDGPPVLVVPSLVNRWYILDLLPGRSLVAALADRGLNVFVHDWGECRDEDRHLSWDRLVAMVQRSLRRVARSTGHRPAIVGYSMGGTLSTVAAALAPDRVAKLVALAAPIDFARAGALARLVDPTWFDVDAVADAGNVPGQQLRAGFVALRPGAQAYKLVHWLEALGDPKRRRVAQRVEAWASDSVPFPATAYRQYIRELYQSNALALGTHHVGGRRVDLAEITAPVLAVTADQDDICPAPATTALHELCSRAAVETLRIPGGHIGAVVGYRAAEHLYAPLGDWLTDTSCNSIN